MGCVASRSATVAVAEAQQLHRERSGARSSKRKRHGAQQQAAAKSTPTPEEAGKPPSPPDARPPALDKPPRPSALRSSRSETSSHRAPRNAHFDPVLVTAPSLRVPSALTDTVIEVTSTQLDDTSTVDLNSSNEAMPPTSASGFSEPENEPPQGPMSAQEDFSVQGPTADGHIVSEAERRGSIFGAVLQCDEEQLATLLMEGYDLNEPSSDGRTPLYLASELGYQSIVSMLIAAGVAVDGPTADGFTPLYGAAENGFHNIVNILVKAGADVNRTVTSDATPLLIAAQKGHLAVVQTLHTHGAKVNAVARNGATPLLMACQNGHDHVIDYLVRHGADVNAVQHEFGMSPLHAAALNGHESVVMQLLAEGVSVNTTMNDGVTALHAAAFNGHDPIVRLLVENGADVFAVSEGQSALQIAQSQGFDEIARLLRLAMVKADALQLVNAQRAPPAAKPETPSAPMLTRGSLSDHDLDGAIADENASLRSTS